MQLSFIEIAQRTCNQPLLTTICLSADAILASDQIAQVVETMRSADVAGYYLVLEKPKDAYLTSNPIWLANALDLVAGLRHGNRQVIIGYANQQQLILACSGATAIASGSWANVRSFRQAKFQSEYGNEFKPSPGGVPTYYYCPQAFSEYTLPYLDIATRTGQIRSLKPEPNTQFCEQLFLVPQPSSSGWSQTDSFKHYLDALRIQAKGATLGAFDSTIALYRSQLDRADLLLEELREKGILSRERDFRVALDASRAALIALEQTQGPLLRRYWK